MRIKNFILGAVIAAIPTLAIASPYPWKKTAKGITQSHKDMASTLKNALNKKGIEYPLSVDPFTAHWNNKRRIEAISNVEKSNLTTLLSGHYFVGTYLPWAKNPGKLGDNLTVLLFASDGGVYGCWAISNKKQLENSAQWVVHNSYAGFGGIITDTKKYFDARPKSLPDDLAYSFAYDTATGKSLYYNRGKRTGSGRSHDVYTGHLQKEYAPVFAKICPNLPKVGQVNEALTSRKYSEFVKQGAKAITGIPVVFNQNIDAPLTLEKYFTLHPPVEEK